MTSMWLHHLYTDHHHQVFRYLLSKTGDWHLAEDLTSETFLRAHNAAGTYTNNNPAGWLLTIAANLATDHYRSAYHRRVDLNNDDSDYETLEPASDPAEILITTWDQQQADNERTRRVARVSKAAAGLRSERERRALELYLQGLDIAGTAAALGITSAAVKARRARAFLAIRIELGVGVAA